MEKKSPADNLSPLGEALEERPVNRTNDQPAEAAKAPSAPNPGQQHRPTPHLNQGFKPRTYKSERAPQKRPPNSVQGLPNPNTNTNTNAATRGDQEQKKNNFVKAASFAEYEARQTKNQSAAGKPHTPPANDGAPTGSINTNSNNRPPRGPRPPQNPGVQGQQRPNPASNSGQSQQRTALAQSGMKGSPRASFAAKGQNPNQNLISSLPAGRENAGGNTNQRKTPLKIIPLGGLGEIGKNLTVYEYGNDMFIVDCGLAFPDSDMLGVDIVIPDFTYLEKNVERLRGVLITHGHEDHIGGLAYLLKKVNVPIYATRLTIGLIEGKLKEHGLLGRVSLNVVSPRQTVKLGCMAAEFIRVNHSIPDAVSMAIHTPVGVVIQTGDFKVDFTPIEGECMDLARFGELGNKGVLALLSDSTNSERSGYTASERTVGNSLERLFEQADTKRIIIATFSSNVHRVQQIINCAVLSGRKVAIFGRSMINVMSIGIELGYLSVPDGLIIDIDTMNRYPSEKVVLITTGSQGEPMSALTRMAMNEHKKVSITPEDFIIISANPIPGNEKYVTRVINELMKAGAEVIHEDVHVSGHACQEEQKLLIALTRPKFFIPLHGEYKHLKKHADTAMAVGIPAENIVVTENGCVIETNGTDIKVTGQVPSGRLMVDGLGVGDVGSIVLRDRKHLAEDGLIIVVATIEGQSGTVLAGPDMVSRGFVYVRESEELMTHAKRLLTDTLRTCMASENREWTVIKTKLKDVLSDYIYMKTKRAPMILPVIMEI